MCKKDELVSIIVPVYNVRDYLERCILSILNQSYKKLEIIMVDDGSTDGSGEICDQYRKKDGRIKVIHKKNGGLSSARNSGLDIAQGNYVGFVDSDDYVMEDMYESLLMCMEEGIDIACCGTRYIYNKQRNGYSGGYGKAPKKTVFTNVEAIEELLFHRYMSFSSCDKLYKKDLFDGLRFPVGRTSEDLPVVYELVKRSHSVVNIGRVKYLYYCRENSISRRDFYYRRVDYVLFAAEICRDVQEQYPQYEDQAEAFYIQYMVRILNRICSCKKRRRYQDIEKRLIKALCHMYLDILHNRFISITDRKQYLMLIVNYYIWMFKVKVLEREPEK